MKRRYLAILGIFILVPALNNIFYDTFSKTESIKKGELLANNKQVSPQQLYNTVAHIVQTRYIEENLNHQNWNYWLARYNGKIKTEDDAKVAIDTMIASLDEPYSHFLPQKEFEALSESIAAKIFGIGVSIYDNAGKITIFNIIEDTPAQEAGLMPDDIIIKVNGQDCSGKKIDDVATLIRGEQGSTVELEIRRKNEVFIKNIKRDEIKIKSIQTSIEQNIGHISLNTFLSSDMKNELDIALEKTKDCDGLIIDLRDNTGGLLENAVSIADSFIDNGVIVSVVARNGQKEVLSANPYSKKIHKPIVILINEASASASEIFSGAMKDYNLATIVGCKSFGKGMVQSVIPLPNRTAINLTVAKYLTPKNNDINNKGITPHINVNTGKTLKERSDKQLLAAKKELQRLIQQQKEAVLSKKM